MAATAQAGGVISERLQMKLLMRQLEQQKNEEERLRREAALAANANTNAGPGSEESTSENNKKSTKSRTSASAAAKSTRKTKRIKVVQAKSLSVQENGSSCGIPEASVDPSSSTVEFPATSSSPHTSIDRESPPLEIGELCRSEDRAILPTLANQSALLPKQSESEPSGKFPSKAFNLGDVVRVSVHKVGKKEYEGGTGRVAGRRWNEEHNEILYDVQYVLRKKTEENVLARYVQAEGLSLTNDSGFARALAVKDLDQSASGASHWVRRSVRHAGTDQLSRPNVRDLISRLERDDPNDADMVVLRLKNWLEADTNSQVLTRVFELVAKSKVVQALYVQNMEKAMDDERLQLLVKALRANPRVWALNVGENFKITRRGWERFAEDLKMTGVTHLYAGSESTVYGELKVKMRDAVRDNRVKHDLHIAKWNLSVIWQIGQMWWNPRNSKVVQTFKREEREMGLGGDDELFQVGDRVVLKKHSDSLGRALTWVFGTVVEMGDNMQRLVEVATTGEKLWMNVLDPKLSCSSKHEIVFAEREPGGAMWPALLFGESNVFVWMVQEGEALTFSVDQSEHKTAPFYIDESLPEVMAMPERWWSTVGMTKRYYWGGA